MWKSIVILVTQQMCFIWGTFFMWSIVSDPGISPPSFCIKQYGNVLFYCVMRNALIHEFQQVPHFLQYKSGELYGMMQHCINAFCITHQTLHSWTGLQVNHPQPSTTYYLVTVQCGDMFYQTDRCLSYKLQQQKHIIDVP